MLHSTHSTAARASLTLRVCKSTVSACPSCLDLDKLSLNCSRKSPTCSKMQLLKQAEQGLECRMTAKGFNAST